MNSQAYAASIPAAKTAEPKSGAAAPPSELPTLASLSGLRQQFPALEQKVYGKSLAYLDSAATALKPQGVIEAVRSAYAVDCANVHRGVHALATRATERFEDARSRIAAFFGAERDETVFVRGATEGVNLVAQAFVRPQLRKGDELLITALEHHANIVPWQMLCEQTGAKLIVVPMRGEALIDAEDFRAQLSPRTRFAAFTHVSNAFGTTLAVRELVVAAHEQGVPTLIDGAQAVAHLPVNFAELGCDFYVWSGHKLYGPTGAGVLFGRRERLHAMPPYQGGGEMIQSVSFAKTEFAEPPLRFEAGTPHIAGALGMAAAVDLLQSINRHQHWRQEQALHSYALAQLAEIPRLRLLGRSPTQRAVIPFVIEGTHPSDLATLVDLEGVAIRTGFHCAQPAIEALGLQATARASLGLYSTKEDIDALTAALRKAVRILTRRT